MFTLEQIATAHSKVKSGADFPAYIREIRALGVGSYTTFVKDGHTEFEGMNRQQLQTPAKYPLLKVDPNTDQQQLRKSLLEHQQGKTNYLQFCEHAAASGVEKWMVDLDKMTCAYLDKFDQEILLEKIPGL